MSFFCRIGGLLSVILCVMNYVRHKAASCTLAEYICNIASNIILLNMCYLWWLHAMLSACVRSCFTEWCSSVMALMALYLNTLNSKQPLQKKHFIFLSECILFTRILNCSFNFNRILAKIIKAQLNFIRSY